MPVRQRSFPWVLLAGLASCAGPSLGDDKPANQDPQARRLLDEVAQAYRALPGYSDQGTFRVEVAVDGKARTQTLPFRLVFARPNRIVLNLEEIRLVSDGKTLTSYVAPLKKYTEETAPPKVTGPVLEETELGQIVFSNPAGIPPLILIDLLTGDGRADQVLKGNPGLKLEADRVADGKTSRSLLVDKAEGADLRLLIDPGTKLLRAIEVLPDLKEIAPGPGGQKVTSYTMAWEPSKVSTEAPDAQAFAFQPPEGAKKVAALLEDENNPVRELIGKPAPDFTLTVLDGPGKTRKVTRADLRGKVALIDFWATWCGPCMKELPEIAKIEEAYRDRQDQLVILAVSQDEGKPTALDEVRALVEKTLTEKELKLQGGVGQVALDPTAEVGNSFKVQGIPTVFLLDAKGTVQAAHVGYSPSVRKTLTREIDALLAGKSLLKTSQ